MDPMAQATDFVDVIMLKQKTLSGIPTRVCATLRSMRPQEVPSSGNFEFRNSGIAHYSHQLGALDIGNMMGFSTCYETIKVNWMIS